MQSLLIIISCFFGSFEAISFNVLSPANQSTRVLVPPAVTTIVPVHYEFNMSKHYSVAHMCLGLKLDEEYQFQNNCVLATENHLVLSDLRSGKYELQLMIQGGEMPDDMAVIRFEILEMEDALPTLSIPSPLYFIANDITNASDVSFSIALSDHPLKQEVDICIEVCADPILLETF
jgi:hypothetical protein